MKKCTTVHLLRRRPFTGKWIFHFNLKLLFRQFAFGRRHRTEDAHFLFHTQHWAHLALSKQHQHWYNKLHYSIHSFTLSAHLLQGCCCSAKTLAKHQSSLFSHWASAIHHHHRYGHQSIEAHRFWQSSKWMAKGANGHCKLSLVADAMAETHIWWVAFSVLQNTKKYCHSCHYRH